jgi:hypothetical protein
MKVETSADTLPISGWLTAATCGTANTAVCGENA